MNCVHIRIGSRKILLLLTPHGRSAHPETLPKEHALALLHAGRLDATTRAAVRYLLRHVPAIARLDEGELLGHLSMLVRSNRVALVPVPRASNVLSGLPEEAEAAPASTAALAREEPEATWIEIELVGEDDQPIANAAYRVSRAQGAGLGYEGVLDERGFARIDDIAAGTWTVTFPELDEEAVTFIETTTARDLARSDSQE